MGRRRFSGRIKSLENDLDDDARSVRSVRSVRSFSHLVIRSSLSGGVI